MLQTRLGDWLRLTIAAGGFLSIYVGYKLFCDVPFQRGKTFRRIFVLNLLSGAALALFGVGVLTADLRSVHVPDSGVVRHKRSTEEGSFSVPKVRHNPAAIAQSA